MVGNLHGWGDEVVSFGCGREAVGMHVCVGGHGRVCACRACMAAGNRRAPLGKRARRFWLRRAGVLTTPLTPHCDGRAHAAVCTLPAPLLSAYMVHTIVIYSPLLIIHCTPFKTLIPIAFSLPLIGNTYSTTPCGASCRLLMPTRFGSCEEAGGRARMDVSKSKATARGWQLGAAVEAVLPVLMAPARRAAGASCVLAAGSLARRAHRSKQLLRVAVEPLWDAAVARVVDRVRRERQQRARQHLQVHMDPHCSVLREAWSLMSDVCML